MAEQKYWIAPKGDIIKISHYNIDEHFKFFNNTDIGREYKTLFNIKLKLNPENLYIVLQKGFIRVLELNEILNISYAANSMGNQVPVSPEARDALFTFLLKPEIKEVQYDIFIGSKCHSELLPKKEYAKLFQNIINFNHSLIDKVMKT